MASDNKKKKSGMRSGVANAFFGCIGGLAGFLIGRYFMVGALREGSVDLLPALLLLLVGVCLATFLQVLFHEGGHLVFGLLSGYRFSSFRIGSLMWIEQDGNINFRRLSLAGTGGQCLMSPPPMKNGTFPYVWYNLGGVLMNLITASVAAGVALLCQDMRLVNTFCVMVALMGIAFALMNGIPMRGAVNNDGYNVLALGRSPQALRAFWLQMKINEHVAAGERLRDMPDDWFLLPSDEDMKNSMVAVIGVFACNRLMDEKRFSEADREMERLLSLDSGIVELHRRLLIDDQIYCELVGERKKERLDILRDKAQVKFNKSMKSFPTVLRTEYAYALLAGHDEKKAGEIRGAFEKMARRYPHPQEIESERELMEACGKIMERLKNEGESVGKKKF